MKNFRYKTILIAFFAVSLIGIGVSTELTNIESIFPQGDSVNIEGNLDMNNNNIHSFFSSGCSSGEVMVAVNDDGSYQCVDVSDEVSGDYVARSGDSMTGDLVIDSDGDSSIELPVQGEEGDIRRYMEMQTVYSNDDDNVEAPGAMYWRTSTSSNYGAFIGGYRNDNNGGDPSFGIWLANNEGEESAEEVLTARSDGSSTNRIGIGTNSPSYKLDVDGDVRFRDNLDMNGNSIENIDQISASEGEFSDSFQVPVGEDAW